MLNQFSRTQLLIGPEGIEALRQSRVAVFGIGGVGGYAVEALVRSGVGTLDLIDDDRVCLTNLNRQIHATRKTVGQYKVDVAEARIHEINPDCIVHTYKTFYMPETAAQFDFAQFDYIIDAIDTVTGKLELVAQANTSGTPIISSMGAGNKLDPTAFEVADMINVKDRVPAIFTLSSDGYANSYKTEEEFHTTVKDYLFMLQEHGAEAVSKALAGWLKETSAMGCGDDITMLVAYFTEGSDIPSESIGEPVTEENADE